MTDHPRTARQLLTDYCLSEGVIDGILTIHAHQLAEQIRQDTTIMGEAGDQYALLYADLIDPEAQR
ncbi:hypothetical protein [Streptomyces olivochromogenes]|uniref:Uncharacterized protein n=1 Tax=Streptomyces olivochromogenes TaxID=1963 RepID=A0A250VR50_STROL|nr:hypothetical protein [Streptomyces olivochromogenes]KUN42624.1 hypothetical protein AQJ27_35650 [Streptomyces olivochromogenes]GAX56559.1 hypothetical protein SO3561_08127 [Streptomyces olivochromogenes]